MLISSLELLRALLCNELDVLAVAVVNDIGASSQLHLLLSVVWHDARACKASIDGVDAHLGACWCRDAGNAMIQGYLHACL